MNGKKVHRLKYNPDDYKGIDDYMWNVEEKYTDYLKDKNIFSETALKQSIFYLKCGLKSYVGLGNMTKSEAEEMMEFYWGSSMIDISNLNRKRCLLKNPNENILIQQSNTNKKCLK